MILNSDGKVLKAGAVILSEDRASIVLVYRAKQNDWTFPKGHTEKGEDGPMTALREIKEETGLDVEIIKNLPTNEYVNTEGLVAHTIMYLTKARSSEFKAEHDGDLLEWVKLENVLEKLTYQNLKDYFNLISPELK